MTKTKKDKERAFTGGVKTTDVDGVLTFDDRFMWGYYCYKRCGDFTQGFPTQREALTAYNNHVCERGSQEPTRALATGRGVRT